MLRRGQLGVVEPSLHSPPLPSHVSYGPPSVAFAIRLDRTFSFLQPITLESPDRDPCAWWSICLTRNTHSMGGRADGLSVLWSSVCQTKGRLTCCACVCWC
jgi:hypothetical protein